MNRAPYRCVGYSDPYGLSACCKLRDVAAFVGGFIPVLGDLNDVGTVLTGRDALSGEKVGVGGRIVSAAGVILPVSGQHLRTGGEILTRFGGAAETAADLARQAADASKAGFPHGVSVTARNTPHGSKAAREAVEQEFPVHNTPTRRDKMHRTVELPKPVTQQVADRFNQLFGRDP